jgi:ABC-2 type transport system permease protein
MNSPSTAMPRSPSDSQGIAPVTMTPTQPLYWSVRRELWESRSITFAPLVVACIALFGFIISAIGLPERRRALLLLDPEHARAAVEKPYDIAALVLILTSILVGAFYCLDALHAERRDRSILFWKSLPVSDVTTVLAKASVPLVILPLYVFALIVATQIAMMLLTDAMLLLSGQSATTWGLYPLFHHSLILFYGLIVLALWHAPIYGWLLLVSGWARRATFLWAVLPLFAVSILERIGFGTSHFASLLKYRFVGGIGAAFAVKAHDANAVVGMPEPEPLKFLATPGLWIGLAVAAAFLLAAVRLRRYREPI